MGDYVDSESSSDLEVEIKVKSEVGVLGLDSPSSTSCSKPIGGGLASSSQSHLKPYFVGMGFSPSLVEKVLRENGEDNADLLLETLFTYSAIEKSPPESPDSLDGIFSDHEDGSSSAELLTTNGPKIEEFDVPSEVNGDKRASLLMMNFSVQEVDFAIDKLGEDAPVNELVDFIVAAQIAKSAGRDINDATNVDDRNEEGITIETLFGTMDKTLRLLEMGFSEDEISSAIDKYGAEIPVGELADSIFASRIADTRFIKQEDPSSYHCSYHSHTEDGWPPLGSPVEERNKRHCSETLIPKAEESNSNDVPFVEDVDFKNILKGKRPKHEYEEYSTFLSPLGPKTSTVKPKSTTFSMPSPHKDIHQLAEESFEKLKMPQPPKPNPCRSLHQMLAKPPYFFYGNVLDVSHDTWSKISQFLYAIAPEFVNTQFFSALSRKEGYIHNLPTDTRSYILPRPPMTIEDAMPHTKKWWPSWDNRKQLSCISSETKGISQLCERLGRILIDSQGMLSKEQQTDILHHCKTLNLVWVGMYKLSPIEPEQLECMLGYPSHHTQVVGCDLTERLKSLKHCFQTDTLGYHLSILKLIFPDGLTMLSLYSGIGGAEVALHRLGVRLKGVVSVEASETNRRILKRWWHSTRQTSELVQIEDINKLTSNKLESLIKHFGGFDLICCQNPCAYSSGSSKLTFGSDNPAGLDFSLFYEFVRVLQRVRSTMKSR